MEKRKLFSFCEPLLEGESANLDGRLAQEIRQIWWVLSHALVGGWHLAFSICQAPMGWSLSQDSEQRGARLCTAPPNRAPIRVRCPVPVPLRQLPGPAQVLPIRVGWRGISAPESCPNHVQSHVPDPRPVLVLAGNLNPNPASGPGPGIDRRSRQASGPGRHLGPSPDPATAGPESIQVGAPARPARGPGIGLATAAGQASDPHIAAVRARAAGPGSRRRAIRRATGRRPAGGARSSPVRPLLSIRPLVATPRVSDAGPAPSADQADRLSGGRRRAITNRRAQSPIAELNHQSQS